MELITEENLDAILDNISDLDEEALSELFSDYFGRQPFLMTYIMSITETLENDASRNDLVFMLLLVMESFYGINKNIPIVTEEQIEVEENKQLEMLEKFENVTDPDKMDEMAMAMVASQVNLFEYISGIIGGDEEDGSDSNFNDDDAGAAFGGLKLVTDLLTKAIDG